MAIETIHTGSKVIDAMTQLGDLHSNIVPPKGCARSDDLCSHAASRHDQAVLDQRRDGSLDRHMGNIKSFRERLDRRQRSTHSEPTTDDLGANRRRNPCIPRYGGRSRICHTPTLPK